MDRAEFWDDNELMLWAVSHGWTVFMTPTGWNWYPPSHLGHGYFVATDCAGDRTDDMPRLNDTVRPVILEWRQHMRRQRQPHE